jgi:predicted esterase
MRRIVLALCLALSALAPSRADAQDPRVHEVADGQTLGKIARRYHVSVEALCRANHIRRTQRLHLGQKLLIPAPAGSAATTPSPADPPAAAPAASPSAGSNSGTLEISGGPPAYYHEPTGAGRFAMRPVIVYLHGRGGDPKADCQRWAPVARPRGWLICPSGPEARDNGGRGWDNDWTQARRIVLGAVNALRAKFGRRVQLYGNTLVGFSEGAYVAMNVGVREPRTFNRWLILAANDRYWGGPGVEALRMNRDRVRRVFLITGSDDAVVDGTEQVVRWLRQAGVPTRVATPTGMGHEGRLGTRAGLYSEALDWLGAGAASKSRGKRASAE